MGVFYTFPTHPTYVGLGTFLVFSYYKERDRYGFNSRRIWKFEIRLFYEASGEGLQDQLL